MVLPGSSAARANYLSPCPEPADIADSAGSGMRFTHKLVLVMSKDNFLMIKLLPSFHNILLINSTK